MRPPQGNQHGVDALRALPVTGSGRAALATDTRQRRASCAMSACVSRDGNRSSGPCGLLRPESVKVSGVSDDGGYLRSLSSGETELTVQLVAVCVLPNFTKFKMQSERLSDLLTRVNKKVRKSRHCICSRWVANTAQSPGREVKFSRQCNQPLAKPHPPPFTCPGKSPV